MTIETVIEIVLQSLLVTIFVVGPSILAAMAVGMIVAILQAATQIQETSLTFVPKLLAVGVTLIVTGRWSINHLVGFFHDVLNRFPTVSQ
ncbi:MAG: flagellar biosynthetic protein FliQ [Deltaproteobacteria bacterium]|nr:flagellar biosynthetic protein FliQ [Deltaproteobacteria bacterium]